MLSPEVIVCSEYGRMRVLLKNGMPIGFAGPPCRPDAPRLLARIARFDFGGIPDLQDGSEVDFRAVGFYRPDGTYEPPGSPERGA